MCCRTALLALVCLTARAADLWTGIPAGPHSVGFRFERTTDPARRVSLGIAVWYPASAASGTPMTQLDYRTLTFSRGLDNAARRAFLDSEAEMMVGWRHVGIVPLTIEQARAAVSAPGRAVRGAPTAPGRFPVVLVLGGPWYLSTTAEVLASRGFLVAAPVRFADIADPVPTLDFSWSVENNARDAEWALAELARDPAADTTPDTALGQGGGGMQALILAMRNPAIRAVVNIDAGNFSKRTNPSRLAFYHPRLLREPYLNILTAATRESQDLFSDFESMRFSRRHEVILADPALRHHDLSDVGRGVSAVLGVRGDAQDMVLRTFADLQQTIVRFLQGDATVGTVRPAVEPAPATLQVIAALSAATPAALRDARLRDPDAPVFGEDDLRKIVEAARGRPALAAELARFALEIHPKSHVLHRAAAEASAPADAAGFYRRCAALDPPQNDWRASIAHNACREQARQ
jgi:hypothetical protein